MHYNNFGRNNFQKISKTFKTKLFSLQIEIQGEANPLTALVVDLEDVDPDDAFSVVPYEKGAAFLWYLEELVGGPGNFMNLPRFRT